MSTAGAYEPMVDLFTKAGFLPHKGGGRVFLPPFEDAWRDHAPRQWASGRMVAAHGRAVAAKRAEDLRRLLTEGTFALQEPERFLDGLLRVLALAQWLEERRAEARGMAGVKRAIEGDLRRYWSHVERAQDRGDRKAVVAFGFVYRALLDLRRSGALLGNREYVKGAKEQERKVPPKKATAPQINQELAELVDFYMVAKPQRTEAEARRAIVEALRLLDCSSTWTQEAIADRVRRARKRRTA